MSEPTEIDGFYLHRVVAARPLVAGEHAGEERCVLCQMGVPRIPAGERAEGGVMRDAQYQAWLAGLRSGDAVVIFDHEPAALCERRMTSRRKGQIYTTGNYDRWDRWNFDAATGHGCLWEYDIKQRLIQPGSAEHVELAGIPECPVFTMGGPHGGATGGAGRGPAAGEGPMQHHGGCAGNLGL
jgi:hypothetical protein